MTSRIKTNALYKFYLNIISSIAFIPTIVALVLFLLSLITLSLDQFYPERLFGYTMDIKNIMYPDSVRSLLSTIAGGVITLVVFSFSMVMVVLNQAASSYSPRVLPSLIGQRFHQIIMGIYLGTIAYTFMVLSSIQSKAYAFEVPGISVVVNAFLAFVCLALFVAFIRSISEHIQIGNIIDALYKNTRRSMEAEMEKRVHIAEDKLINTEKWTIIYSPLSGYFDSINESQLIRSAADMDITIRLMVPMGSYINRNFPFFSASRSLSRDEQEEILQTFVMRQEEIVEQNYVYGFKQITEIAVKALSPGINDPGTAIHAIDRLTDLMVIRMKLHGVSIGVDDHQKLRLIYKPVPLEEIFYFCFSAIKNYTAQSVPVMLKLLAMIDAMAKNDDHKTWTNLLIISVKDAVEQFVPDLRSQSDRQRLSFKVKELLVLFGDHSERENILQELQALKT